MNANETSHSKISEIAPRLRHNNDQMLHNHIVYPLSFNISPVFYPINQPIIMSTESQLLNININGHTAEQSGVLSTTNISQPFYRISNWSEISDSYEGNEDKPSGGRLKNNVYFTQRSVSSDVYMLFDKKSDYINNFVNYYFSDKNLARDQKLVSLMNDKGIVPLSALKEFPKLQQVHTTVDDLVQAFQSNSFVGAVDMEENIKGAQRRDRMCNYEKPLEQSYNLLDQVNHKTLGNNPGSVGNSTVTEVNNLSMANNENTSAGPTQQYYMCNQNALFPAVYSQHAGIIPATTQAGGIQSYNQYLMAQFPIGAHTPPNSVGLNQSQNHFFPTPLAFWASQDYNNNVSLLSHAYPYISPGSSHTIMAGSNRFVSTPPANVGHFNVPLQTSASVSSESGENRMN